ncbi:phosphoribosyltransferase [Streptomyces sp. 8N114]|uniref:phosphoribosyltransferase n=1 Tax=Streptomyces sp. 8N114 TaxID=3457419 RepID=UPI003FD318C0
MDLDEALRCLAEAEGDQRRPELCGGRYLAVAYGEGLELDVSHLRARGVEEFAARGGAASFYEALDLLVDDFLAATGDTAEDLLDRLDDAGPANDDRPPLADIVSPRRRLLALILLGSGGPMDIVTERFKEDSYLGDALADLPHARFVLLASAEPPNQDFALGVLELGGGRAH